LLIADPKIFTEIVSENYYLTRLSNSKLI